MRRVQNSNKAVATVIGFVFSILLGQSVDGQCTPDLKNGLIPDCTIHASTQEKITQLRRSLVAEALDVLPAIEPGQRDLLCFAHRVHEIGVDSGPIRLFDELN